MLEHLSGTTAAYGCKVVPCIAHKTETQNRAFSKAWRKESTFRCKSRTWWPQVRHSETSEQWRMPFVRLTTALQLREFRVNCV